MLNPFPYFSNYWGGLVSLLFIGYSSGKIPILCSLCRINHRKHNKLSTAFVSLSWMDINQRGEGERNAKQFEINHFSRSNIRELSSVGKRVNTIIFAARNWKEKKQMRLVF